MRPYLFVCFLVLASSCGVKKSSSYEMGKTTRAEVIALKGEPVSEVANPGPNSTTIRFKDEESFQLKGDIVVNHFANPGSDEMKVIWWKHRFKDCSTRTTELARGSDSHTPPEMELSCPSEGLSVIYTQGSDSVSRVVQFEK